MVAKATKSTEFPKLLCLLTINDLEGNKDKQRKVVEMHIDAYSVNKKLLYYNLP